MAQDALQRTTNRIAPVVIDRGVGGAAQGLHERLAERGGRVAEQVEGACHSQILAFGKLGSPEPIRCDAAHSHGLPEFASESGGRITKGERPRRLVS